MIKLGVLLALGLAACGASDAAPAGPRWIAGDLHMHVAPMDAREGQTLDVAAVAQLAQKSGLEFVIATPHVHPQTWGDPSSRKAWLAKWSKVAADARAQTAATIIPGVEFTDFAFGHFGVSGVDLNSIGDDFLADATKQGAFVVVNHPFATPTRIPGIPISEANLSFRPWSAGSGTVPHLDGVEVWNVPLGFANVLSRQGGLTGEQRAFVAADKLARTEKRRVAVVGGSDSHRPAVMATTWVLAQDRSEAAILAGLRAGRTCVGGPAGGSLEARGDKTATWARIGDSVKATKSVELRWTGDAARVFVDGVDQGEHPSPFTAAAGAGVHTYRIELGSSRCGFVYANL